MARPLMFRISGTVILNIWWQIILMAAYTAFICALHNYVNGFRMNFPQTLIPVLGVVTGLLLVFRTNTAYDRYGNDFGMDLQRVIFAVVADIGKEEKFGRR